MKRRRSDEEYAASRPTKRLRGARSFADLPREILLRTLTYLPIQQLTILELVSRDLRRLALDSHLWRIKYYEDFVESRAKRIPSAARPSPTKLAKWLEHGEALRDGEKMDWKKRYRLRRNWTRGDARLHEVELAKPSAPAVLARVRRGLVVTADAEHGLRLWSQARSGKTPDAQIDLVDEPISLAVDEDRIAVGFSDHVGIFEVGSDRNIRHLFNLEEPSTVTSVAFAKPYLVTMTKHRKIELYQVNDEAGSTTSLAVLHADATLQPAALSLRSTTRSVVATIAYAFSRLGEGWCLGLQEIKLSKQDGVVESRLASNIDTPLDSLYRGPKQWEITSRSAFSTPLTMPFSLNPEVKHPPTSLSYSHPFLLASLADNTIMSYIVQSDDESLDLSSGKRLFGHTSAITAAEVSNRGKAVSVSARGDEIRVWELEEVLTTARGRPSTQVKPRNGALDVAMALARRGQGLGLVLQEMKKELAMTRRWVSFDDEQVVVLGERDHRQIMACYDFS
jgi:hypothetical protein